MHISAELGTKKWESRLLFSSCFVIIVFVLYDTLFVFYDTLCVQYLVLYESILHLTRE